MTDKNFSITLGEYKGIKRAPITADVTNDEVQAAIKQEQEQRAKMHDVERRHSWAIPPLSTSQASSVTSSSRAARLRTILWLSAPTPLFRALRSSW